MQNNKKWSNETKGMVLASLFAISGVVLMTNSNFWSRTPSSSSKPVVVTSQVPAQSFLQTSTTVSSVTVENTKEREMSFQHKKVDRMILPANRTILLLGPVGDNALVAANKITEMSNASIEPIYLVLSGPGGSVLTGNILIAAMEASQAPVYTICDVLCASMDSMIHQYGKKRYMTDHTIIMFHPAAAGAQGDVDRMYSMVAFLKRYTNKIEAYVASRQGISFEAYKAKIGTELWIDSEDAFADKINDGIVNYMVPRSLQFQMDGSSEEQKRKNNDTKTEKIITESPLDFDWICDKCKGTKWATPKFY